MKQSSLLKFLSSVKKTPAPPSLPYEKSVEEVVPLSRLKKVDDENSMDIENYVFSSQKSDKKQEIKQEKQEKQEKQPKPIPEKSDKKQKIASKKPIQGEEQVEDFPNICIPNSSADKNIYEEFDDVTPSWAQEGQSRDKNGNLHGTSEANPSTLLIPEKDFKKLTKSMQQYWKIKSENFDKIIFFKLGKFYELFYEDAMVGNKYLDLNWMGKKMHTGFPEKVVGKFAKALLDYGFKVAVVDQVETPDQMQKRITENRKSGVGNTDKIVHRELTQVLTKGTYLYEEGEEGLKPEEKILLVIRKRIIDSHNEQYGIAMLERSTNVISLAFLENKDKSYEKLKTLLLHMRPVEVVLDQHNIPSYDTIHKMIKGDILRSIVSVLSQKADNWDSRKALFRLEQIYPEKLPEGVEYFKENDLVMQSMSGLFSYLHSIQIMERVLECAKFKIYDQIFSLQQSMILDSQALFHLEILESPGTNDKRDYSVLGVINKTTTPGGYRLLRKWVCAPLYQKEQIENRQIAVQDISRFRKERDLLRMSIKNYPDLERICSRIYEYSIKSESKAIFYENLSQTRLKEFKLLVEKLREVQQDLVIFGQLNSNFKSKRLINLLTFENNGGLLPDVGEILDDFQNYIQWEGITPQPVSGILQSYDDAVIQVENIEKKLQDYLMKIRQKFNNDKNINYSHAKFRYEIEMPVHLVEKKQPDDFEFTSTRAGFKRYNTKFIKDLVVELEEAEDLKKEQLTLFVQFVFKNFRNNQMIWDKLITTLSEIDCLCSLSVFSDTFEGTMCWPKFISNSTKLIITNGKHPCLTNINFVSNSIDMGGKLEKFLLLTGPNMGGKSTTLRMVCVLTILAQLGCMVPCESMELSPVDRIFTRIGARDYLIEGKSTFYVELEETLVPLRYATNHSLFITDELGRGTSTYDGVAIASAVMNHLIKRIGCRVLFATHFRILVEEAKLKKGVSNVHMSSYIEGEQVIFLYRLRPDACPASFGINVAKAVGIPESIINRAQEMADFFENKAGSKNAQQILKKYNEIMESLQN